MRMFWIDIETTGLDPEKDSILEIACVITDNNLVSIWEKQSLVLHEDVLRFTPWAMETHTRNGLIEDLRTKPGTSKREICLGISNSITEYGAKWAPLAGSSVHFDRAFLKHHGFTFLEKLSHRHIDVSTVRELCKRWYPDQELPPKNETHRAMDDIKSSIKFLKWYRDWL